MADESRRSPGAGSSTPGAAVVSCWMCGIRSHPSEMMPDGGDWCDDARWYCRDTKACTERWTTPRNVFPASDNETRGTGTETGPLASGRLRKAAPASSRAGRGA